MNQTNPEQPVEMRPYSDDKFRLLVEHSLVGIYVIQDERFVYVNPMMAEIFGFSREELTSAPLLSFVFEEDRGLVSENIRKRVQGQVKSIHYALRALRKDGSVIYIEAHGSQTEYEGRSAVLGMLLDITERKKGEVDLQKAHEQLLKASHQAGMAEVATNVLHNVGNVLNSVNVSATCVADTVRKSKAATLTKVVELLRENEADLGAFISSDPKGKQIPAYLAQLAEHLVDERAALLRELADFQKNIGHIKDIVALQQNYAKVSGVMETLQICDLVEDALCMNAGALARHDVQVVREYAEVPPVTIDKHKLLQALVNLIRNAQYACATSGRTDKQLTVRVASGYNRVRISISDNGVGIPSDNLTRIFAHGFTTKKDGHGFGLHSCANAATEMGGSLTVQSDGPGQGATFTLELPAPSYLEE